MRCSLREVFLLVALVAFALGWWLDHARLSKQNETLSRSSKKWEDTTKEIFRRIYDLDSAPELAFVANDFGGERIDIVEPNGETWTPGPDPASRRLFKLIAAIEKHGFRVVFKPTRGPRGSDEDLSLEPPAAQIPD